MISIRVSDKYVCTNIIPSSPCTGCDDVIVAMRASQHRACRVLVGWCCTTSSMTRHHPPPCDQAHSGRWWWRWWRWWWWWCALPLTFSRTRKFPACANSSSSKRLVTSRCQHVREEKGRGGGKCYTSPKKPAALIVVLAGTLLHNQHGKSRCRRV